MSTHVEKISCNNEETLTTSNEELNCSICQKPFSSQTNLDNHFCTPMEETLSCDTCQKRFTTKRKLQNHFRQHTAKKEHVCEICHKILCSKRSLMLHYRRIHTGERPFACDVCGEKFLDGHNLNLHMRYHTGKNLVKCDSCPKFFCNRSLLNKHYLHKHTGDKAFKCEFCGKCFKENHLLKTHYISHSAERKFPCKFCKKTFKRRSNLIYHYASHANQVSLFDTDKKVKHGDPNENMRENLLDVFRKDPVKCPHCNKYFGAKSLMERHVDVVHHSMKAFVCNICKATFKHNTTLVSHYRMHTREKPYKCRYCDKLFVDYLDLKYHVTFKHNTEAQT